MSHTCIWSMVIIASMLGAATACAGGESEVSVLLTDGAGADVREAVVTIDEIAITSSEHGVIVLRDTPVTENLIELANSTATLVKEASIPNGTYEQLRFVISGAYIVVADDDGTTRLYATRDYATPSAPDGALQAPSYMTSGLKVQLPAGTTVFDGAQRILLVDFDVTESFGHASGASDRWTMHPVVTATELELSMDIAVTLEVPEALTGIARDVMPDVKAQLYDAAGNEEASSGFRDVGDGLYFAELPYLAPSEGPFELDLVGATIHTQPAFPIRIDAAEGQTVAVEATVTAF